MVLLFVCAVITTSNEIMPISHFLLSDNIGILSNCCRLLSDTKKLDAFINSIGGTALSVGSCRVSTINLVRIAYESKMNKKKYLSILRDRVLLDCKALYSMRYVIKRNIRKVFSPTIRTVPLSWISNSAPLAVSACTRSWISLA